jgi:phosphoribosylamine--glycine ligase
MAGNLKVLVVGGGGREDALGWKISQSPMLEPDGLFFAPGNGGTTRWGKNVPIKAGDVAGLLKFAQEQNIGLTVVGPEDPLVAGIADAFADAGLKIFGPKAAAAQIEASKSWAKNLMRQNQVPTASSMIFSDYDEALAYLKIIGAPIVIKASGLALGKGAIVCLTGEQAKNALREVMVEKKFGSAGAEVLIEEYQSGQEISLQVICDGNSTVLCPASQDHKRALDHDQGDNTGGMGAYAPVPWVKPAQMRQFQEKIVVPTLEALRENNAPYSGLLYPGLMLTEDGPKVLEFNCRFGDPETQPLMKLLESDLLEVLLACAEGRLDQIKVRWSKGFAVCVVIASGGYPNEYQKGYPISGIKEAERLNGVTVFHAGTVWDEPCQCYKTAGGRVLGVTAYGETHDEAIARAYAGVKCINFKDMHYRSDIAQRELEHKQ